jgi:hypothetical protein
VKTSRGDADDEFRDYYGGLEPVVSVRGTPDGIVERRARAQPHDAAAAAKQLERRRPLFGEAQLDTLRATARRPAPPSPGGDRTRPQTMTPAPTSRTSQARRYERSHAGTTEPRSLDAAMTEGKYCRCRQGCHDASRTPHAARAGAYDRRRKRTVSDYEPKVSGWAVGGATFAAVLLILVGIFQVIAGLAAIFDDDFYVVTQNYAFDLDVSAWGWIHLILGILLVLTGYFLFAGSPWAAGVAIGLAALSAVANFFFIPYYPFWSILLIALAVWVIWSLTRPGMTRA